MALRRELASVLIRILWLVKVVPMVTVIVVEYLKATADLLVQDLEWMEKQWQAGVKGNSQ